MKTVGNFIGGQVCLSSSNQTVDVHNPASGQVERHVTQSTAAEVKQAIDVAHQAFADWSCTTPLRRAHHVQFQGAVGTAPRRAGRAYRQRARQSVLGCAGRTDARHGSGRIRLRHPASAQGRVFAGRRQRRRQLLADAAAGRGGGHYPVQLPAMVPMWMFPIALACGNTFILKPPALVPSASVRLAELLKEAGLPDGVFNVVHCANEDAAQLCTDPRIQAVSFVGSSTVAEHIYTTASAHGKRVQAFGAAKNQAIVMPDADLDATVNALMGGAFGSAGERCMALPIAVVVGDDTADKLIAKLKPLIAQLRVGPGLPQGGEENEMGPLVSSAHQKKVLGYIDLGVEEGATLVADGRNYQVPGYPEGYYVGGTLFDHVKPNMRIYREEIFGPVLGIVRVPDYRTAIDTVNGHEFGNGSAIFTGSGHYARQFVQEVQAGMVGVNVPVPVPMAFHSFGGWKRSVFGALNVHGTDGVRFYTRMKTATARWPAGQQTVSEFSMPTLG